MRSLTDLLGSDAGRDFLAERGMYVDPAAFRARMSAPLCDDLNTLAGLPDGTRLVHIGQQVCLDYHPATTTKFAAARELIAAGDSTPVVLWHDAYAAESERYGMRMVLPSGGKHLGIWLAPRRQGAGEPRFIQIAPDAVDRALDELRKWVTHRMQEQPKERRGEAQARVARLAEAVRSEDVGTLGEANAAFANFLLREALRLQLPSAFLSTMLAAGLLTPSLNSYLACLDDVRQVFNETVADLAARDIDPQVAPLKDDYLPLRYSCPADGSRLALRHERAGPDHFAAATCRCGATHRFHLGTGTASIGELAGTDRWSPDVSLPIHHRDFASGWIVGQSTALYGLVMNAVVERVLGARPIPGLIPPDLLGDTPSDQPQTSLLVDYLTS